MSTREDIATFFNAVVLDPIINYEIEHDNFEGYSHCWNDTNTIVIETKDNMNKYQIGKNTQQIYH